MKIKMKIINLILIMLIGIFAMIVISIIEYNWIAFSGWFVSLILIIIVRAYYRKYGIIG